MIFAHCPLCGEKLAERIIGDEGAVPFCERCGRPFFSFSYPCVICLVHDGEGNFALIKQGYVSQNHVCVAGYIKRGETAEETAEREVFEETGLCAQEVQYLGSYYHERSDNLMLGFAVRVKRGEFKLSGEVDSAGWYSIAQTRGLLSPGSVGTKLLAEFERLNNENSR